MPFVGWVAARGTTRSVLLALIPGGLTAYFAYTFFVVTSRGAFSVSAGWAPALNLSL